MLASKEEGSALTVSYGLLLLLLLLENSAVHNKSPATMAVAGSSPASISSPFSSVSFLPAAPDRPSPSALARVEIG